jgi:hypothetical protein
VRKIHSISPGNAKEQKIPFVNFVLTAARQATSWMGSARELRTHFARLAMHLAALVGHMDPMVA